MNRYASAGAASPATSRGRRPQRHRRRGRALLLLAGALLVAAVGVTAWLTLPRWYSTWMPAEVGKTAFPLEHADVVRAAAGRHRLDPVLVAAVIYVESGFDESVESRSGAVGLMQVMPQTAREIARHSGGTRFALTDLRLPRVNVRYGCYYLRRLLERYRGSVVCALAAYNAGAANVDEWRSATGGQLRAAAIPFGETRRFVQKVLRARIIYRHVYGPQLALSAKSAGASLQAPAEPGRGRRPAVAGRPARGTRSAFPLANVRSLW